MSENTSEQPLTLLGMARQVQNEEWIKREKIELRKIALATVQGLNLPSASQALEEADKIYKWLIEIL